MGLAAVVDPADRQCIETGNALANFCAGMMYLARRFGLPASLENPFSSRLWLVPRLCRIRRWPTARFIKTCFCMWGKPWRKNTGFLSLNLSLDDASRVCTGRLCSRTGRRHYVLEGPQRTLGSEAYPDDLVKEIARCFDVAHGYMITQQLSRVWG